jgi:hypothetical protein
MCLIPFLFLPELKHLHVPSSQAWRDTEGLHDHASQRISCGSGVWDVEDPVVCTLSHTHHCVKQVLRVCRLAEQRLAELTPSKGQTAWRDPGLEIMPVMQAQWTWRKGWADIFCSQDKFLVRLHDEIKTVVLGPASDFRVIEKAVRNGSVYHCL